MAKKASEESAYYKRLMKAADKLIAQEMKEEESQMIIQAGKEFAVFLVWFFQIGMPIKLDEMGQYIALFLRDYPDELMGIMDFYSKAQEYDLRKKIRSFRPSIIDGELRLHIGWNPIVFSIGNEGGSQQDPQR